MARATVVILSHRPRMLPRAVRSVLRQTVPCQVIVQHDRDAWPGKFNEAARIAHGDFIIPLCDDDTLHPTYVARCMEFAGDGDMIFTDRNCWWTGWVDIMDPRTWFHRSPRFGYWHKMFGPKVAALANSQHARALRVDDIHLGAFERGSPLPMTCCIRRTLWQDLQGYDEMPHADTDLWYRAVKDGARVVYIPEPLFNYHYHRDQISRTQPSHAAAVLAFDRKHFMDFGNHWQQRPDAPHLYDLQKVAPEDRPRFAAGS